jgi:MoxR-like ATPase
VKEESDKERKRICSTSMDAKVVVSDRQDASSSRRFLTYLEAIHETIGLLLVNDSKDRTNNNNNNNGDDTNDERMIVDDGDDEKESSKSEPNSVKLVPPASEVEYMDEIAKRIVLACDIHRLSQGIQNLPPLDIFPNDYDVVDLEEEEEDSNDDEDDEQDENALRRRVRGQRRRRPLPPPRPYQLRRVDYVRRICLALAPVSMDVAVRIITTATTRTTCHAQSRAVFVLFSIWLPIAPQLMPMVTDLFLQETFQPFQQEDHSDDDDASNSVLLLLLEAAWKICRWYCTKNQQYSTILRFWDWSPIFAYLEGDGDGLRDDGDNDAMDIDNEGNNDEQQQQPEAFQYYSEKRKAAWYAIRVAGYLFNWAPGAKAAFFQKHNLHRDGVPFVRFEWDVDQEELEYEQLWIQGETKLFDGMTIPMPHPTEIRQAVPLHENLVTVDDVLVFWKKKPLPTVTMMPSSDETKSSALLVRTPTTVSNLSLLATALGSRLPILVCGPSGIGKSAWIRELARVLSDEEILEIHIDETTDTKSLLGSYTVTDIPGEFAWQPGALTQAIRTGRWVILEDVGGISYEIQASLVNLFKSRQISINGQNETCHPNFRLWGTYTTLRQATDADIYDNKKKGLLHPDAWIQIHVDPLPMTELQEIAVHKFRNLPDSIIQAVLKIIRSVRELLQVLSRISKLGIEGDFVTEQQRLDSLLECFDVIAGALSDPISRRDAVRAMAEIWEVSVDLASAHIFFRCPQVRTHETFTEIGRARIPIRDNSSRLQNSSSFVQTSHVLRLMESVAVCIHENEPTLLVGETGTVSSLLNRTRGKSCNSHIPAWFLSCCS